MAIANVVIYTPGKLMALLCGSTLISVLTVEPYLVRATIAVMVLTGKAKRK